jgi:hypothetical protein
LPNLQLVVIFIINGKEIGERSLAVDFNQEFNDFEAQLLRLCRPKLPKGLNFGSDGVEILYKRAYVTRAQELKRKDLNWKDFADEEDYSGLIHDIKNSQASKMTLMIRAFIIVPKDQINAQIEPTPASQRIVCSLLIRVDNRLLLHNKSKLWRVWCVMPTPSNFKIFKRDGDVQLILASSVTDDMMKYHPLNMLNSIQKLYPIGPRQLSIKHTLSTSTPPLADQSGMRSFNHGVVKAAVLKHHNLILNLQYMYTCLANLHVVHRGLSIDIPLHGLHALPRGGLT